MEKLNLEQFNQIPNGYVFARGKIENSSNGLYMSNNGGILKWIAKKGYSDDWAVYTHWAYNDWLFIEEQGDKVTTKEYIQQVVPCTDEVMNRYRI